MPWPRLEQPAYSGPLDLLLYLVEQEEVDPTSIRIHLVIEPYLMTVRALQAINLEEIGEFLVIAATLVELKSLRLLPGKESAVSETDRGTGSVNDVVVDSKEELIRQLAEYRRYRAIALALHGMASEQAKRMVRRTKGKGELPANLQPVELWDLVSAYARLVRETRPASVERLVVDFVPLPVILNEVLSVLARRGKITLRELVGSDPPKTRVIGLFLAILELLKSGEILAGQENLYGDIWILPAGEGPQEIISDAVAS